MDSIKPQVVLRAETSRRSEKVAPECLITDAEAFRGIASHDKIRDVICIEIGCDVRMVLPPVNCPLTAHAPRCSS